MTQRNRYFPSDTHWLASVPPADEPNGKTEFPTFGTTAWTWIHCVTVSPIWKLHRNCNGSISLPNSCGELVSSCLPSDSPRPKTQFPVSPQVVHREKFAIENSEPPADAEFCGAHRRVRDIQNKLSRKPLILESTVRIECLGNRLVGCSLRIQRISSESTVTETNEGVARLRSIIISVIVLDQKPFNTVPMIRISSTFAIFDRGSVWAGCWAENLNFSMSTDSWEEKEAKNFKGAAFKVRCPMFPIGVEHWGNMLIPERSTTHCCVLSFLEVLRKKVLKPLGTSKSVSEMQWLVPADAVSSHIRLWNSGSMKLTVGYLSCNFLPESYAKEPCRIQERIPQCSDSACRVAGVR